MTESPIEDDLLDAMRVACRARPYVLHAGVPYDVLEGIVRSDGRCRLHIAMQVSFGRYRADFILAKSNNRLCVECDGEQFHRATHAQIARDKIRDDWMEARAVRVMRFTGKQIKRDPYKCARQALSAVTGEDFRRGEATGLDGALDGVLRLAAENMES